MAAASGRGAVAPEEEFSARELEVAAILADLPSIVRAERRRRRRLEKQRQQARPEIPTWGRRRPRKAPAVSPTKKPAAAIVAAAVPAPAEDDDRHDRRDGAASPDTPLAFPADDDHDDDYDDRKKAAHDEWVQQQRGAVASLSHENAHLVKQIEEFRARLETSRSAHDSLSSQMHHSKHKKRNRPEEEEEEERRWKLQARAAAAAERPALDLNEPAEADAEDAKPPQSVAAQQQWCRGYQLQQLVQQKADATAAARRRRREIRRAKGSAGSGRTRRLG